ncbi:MAG TPA: hypothetical protein VHO23_01025 [Candidatus Paceibacterota bacterium]|nr:hypothetical protein [Candidatus Paceibacterota bacterium]
MRVIHYPGGKVISEVTMRRNSNFHAHFRRGAMMRAVTRFILQHVRYALVMPNTGPIRTIEELVEYWRELMAIAAEEVDHQVDLIMTLYFTDLLTPAVIQRIKEAEAELGIRIEVKWYPPAPGATTGSDFGIPLALGHETLLEMERLDVPLLGHFEDTEDAYGRVLPPEQREGHMVEHVLWKFRDQYPMLRHSFEHASTAAAVEYVKADTSGRTAMTVTPQHSLFTVEDFDDHGSELKCMPIVKTPEDRAAIVAFIITGDPRAIAGDDTAPHPHKRKSGPFADAANGCWLPHSLEMYAEVFDRERALDERFERFMSLNGPAWRELPLPGEDDTITLRRKKYAPIPDPVEIPGEDDVVVPLGWSPEGSKLNLSFYVV